VVLDEVGEKLLHVLDDFSAHAATVVAYAVKKVFFSY
jgi:hypothetical protein